MGLSANESVEGAAATETAKTAPGEAEPLERTKRIPELDGLRGFAILIVVLLHYFYKPGALAPAGYRHFQAIFRLGWVGVDLFFVLSGFLIGGILLEARTSKNYFKTFYTRRFFRIIPIYYAWIALYIVLIVAAGDILRQHMHSGLVPPLGFQVYSHFLFIQNIWIPEYVTVFLWWFGVTWSLAVEEQFYLVAPLLFRFVPGQRLLYVLLGVVIGAPLLRTYVYLHENHPHLNTYLSMPCRADSLAYGALAALLWRRREFRAWVRSHCAALYTLLAVLAAGMAAMWLWFSNPVNKVSQTVGYSWTALFFAVVLVTVLGDTDGMLARVARQRWLGALGRVSYCVYLIHLAVAYFCFGLILRKIPYIADARSIALAVLCAGLTYGIALLSWRHFEKPLIQRGHAYSYGGARA